ncbi:MAG: MFS transporter [Spirochaetales bacterium]|nr:MFS transporter [Spirochaetales bacterium]
MAQLSQAARRRARGSYYAFNVLNSVSFALLSGSFVTLLALRLGATGTELGLLNAFGYATFFFMPLGKRLVRRHRIVGVYAFGWAARYLGMAPILAAPFLSGAGHDGLAIGAVLLGSALFNVFRGIGMIGNNPVLAHLGEGRDRGSFIMTVQVIANVAGMGTSLAAALLLGRDAGAGLYATLVGAGMAVGLAGTMLLARVPEPEAYRPAAGSSAFRTARDSFHDKGYRAFLAVFLPVSVASGAARSFLPVWAKSVYSQGDDLVMLWSLLASLGSVSVGLVMKRVIDRLGAKPLYAILGAVAALALAPVAVSPGFGTALGAALFTGGVTFLASFGLAGAENAGQTYHFALVPRERTLDLSIVYFVAFGLGGTLGASAGGFLLDALKGAGVGVADAYRALFASSALVLGAGALLTRRLTSLDALPIRESLGVLFSPRDLKAFDLLGRLERSDDPGEEVRIIHELGELANARSSRELGRYLASPRFEVRIEALLALENLERVDERTLAALADEIERNPYTTAYVAARILGKRGGARHVPLLRAAAASDDYMLSGAAVIALARLGDSESAELVERLLTGTDNPRVRIACASALEIFGDRRAVPALVASLRRQGGPGFASDELVLAIATLLGLMDGFYPVFRQFREERDEALDALRSAFRERTPPPGRDEAARYDTALEGLFAEPDDGAAMARLCLSLGADESAEIVLAEAVLDSNLSRPELKLFAAAYVALGGARDARTRRR